ncbi:MAG: FG-GAP-like repeat-containing protein, partial [Methylovulum sp.]|nr:FG-GAP-like repeat-containing protein [Methylovulum sp.]
MADPNYTTILTNPYGLTAVSKISDPTFVDIDNDGDLDAFIGRSDEKVVFFRNTGTASNPAYAAPTINPFNISKLFAGNFDASPDFVDIDGDGDLDLFIGTAYAHVEFFRNTGSASNPAFAAPVSNPFGLSNNSGQNKPDFVDIDHDGDMDVFIGNQFGETFFFRNTGSASNPAFAAPVSNPFGIPDLGFQTSPKFVDIDGDGDFDALIADNASGNFFFLRNTGTASSPAFAAPVTNPFGVNQGNRPKVDVVDIDGDGDLDFITGDYHGNTIVYLNNIKPTLTSLAAAVASGTEDTQITISFSALQTQGNEADADGTVTGFVVKAVSTGTLKIGTSAGTATAWAAGSNDTIDATHQAYWTPAANANGTLNAFTVTAKDNSGAESASPVQTTVSVTAVNDLPTLTSFASTVASGNEDNEITVSFNALQTQGNEADADGTISAFIVKAVSTGSLKIGTSAATATAWNAVSNATLDATHQAYWTPAANANGTLNAFTVTVKDNSGGESASPVQTTVSVTAVNDAPIGIPVVNGTATQGQVLTANTVGISDAEGLGIFSYVWKANGTVIGGASGSTYVLTEAEVGKTITVSVSFTDGLGSAEGPLSSVATAIVVNVNDVPVGIPTITGSVTQGATLTADTSGISDADGLGVFSYVWKANGTVIGGASASSYVLTEQEVGKTITVEVSYTDGHSTAEGPLSSTATAVVTNSNESPVGIPTITGTASQGQTLTAVTGGISDGDGLGAFSYVWKANGTVIGGASANSYMLTEQEVGKTITVEVSYTDGHSTAEGPLSSTATATVANVNDAPVGIPTITGTARQGQTLTAVTGGIS